jgi:polysaccharide transporter, PST family
VRLKLKEPKSLLKRKESSIRKNLIDRIKPYYEKYPGLSKILSNISWLVLDRIARMGIGLFLGAWVARYLGPDQFGQMNSALAIVSIFGIIAGLGLDDIVIRDLVKHPDNKYEILGSAFLLKLMGGILSMILISFIALTIYRQDTPYVVIILLTSLSLLFQAVNVIDLWFQSRVLSKYVVYARNIAFILTAGYKVVLIMIKASIEMFIIASLFELLIGTIGMIMVFIRCKLSILKFRFSFSQARVLMQSSWPLILSGFIVMVYMRSDQIMLSAMRGSQEVGYYSAAMKISEIWYFIPTTISASVFPSIIKSRENNLSEYYRRLQNLFNLMAVIALSVAIPITFFSNFIIKILYGVNYLASGPVLAIHIWAGVFVFLGIVRGSWLIAEGYTKLMFATTLAGAIINLFLNYLLIPVYGAIGASIATVFSQCMASYVSNLVYKKTQKIFYMQTKAIFMLDIIKSFKLYKANL